MTLTVSPGVSREVPQGVTRVVASAPGKVNLVLLVAKPDHRNYHPLYSVFEALNMRETADVRIRPRGADEVPCCGYPIVVSTFDDRGQKIDFAGLDERKHLAWRAAAKLIDIACDRALGGTEHTESEKPEVDPSGVLGNEILDIRITKRIPVAGGMAGGSADAAATLVAVNEAMNLGLNRDELHEIGRGLGADVPACLEGGISLGLGYGDHMTRLDLDQHPEHHWVMVTSKQGLSTPAVFKEFDSRGRGRDKLPAALRPDDLLALSESQRMAAILENDLQETARELHPTLNQAWQAVEQTDALAVLLSGSGPTIAVLARDGKHAKELQETLQNKPGIANAFVTSGPSAPARIEN